MKKTFKFLILCFLTLTCLSVNFEALARTDMRSSDYIDSYRAYISVDSEDNIYIYFTITCKEKMKNIGATTIVLQESIDGSIWDTINTYYYQNYNNMLVEKRITWSSNLLYSGIDGHFYRAYVNFLAVNNTGSGETRQVQTNTAAS